MASSSTAPPDQSSCRVLYLGSLGSSPKGAKPQYLQKYFKETTILSIKQSSRDASRTELHNALTSFRPDVIVAHGSGVAKAAALVASPTVDFSGSLVLLAGSAAALKQAGTLTAQAVVVVLAKKAPEFREAKQVLLTSPAMQSGRLQLLELDDVADLNATLVGQNRLRHIIESAQKATEQLDAKQRIRWLLSESDLNEDGAIDAKEMHKLFSSLSETMSEAAVRTIINKAASTSESNEGKTDIDELVDWIFDGSGKVELPPCDETNPGPDGGFKNDGEEEEDEADPEQESDEGKSDDEEKGKPTEASAPEVEAETGTAGGGGGEEEAGAGAGAGAAKNASSGRPEPESESGKTAPDRKAEAASKEDSPQAEREKANTALSARAADGGIPASGGQLFTWGRGSDGQLGQDKMVHPKPNCAMPYPVPNMRNAIQVACGGGQQGCTAVVTSDGALYTFGNNFHGRLGLGESGNVRTPTRVAKLDGKFVFATACGSDHMGALVRVGESTELYMWGNSTHGQLGLGASTKGDVTTPTLVPLQETLKALDCEDHYTAVVTEQGRLFTWGAGVHGRLGLGDDKNRYVPTEVKFEVDVKVASVSLGSLYMGVISTEGSLFMWGYGGHGNLGTGTRKSSSAPLEVAMPEKAAQLACTRGQEGCKGGLNPKGGGQEGPHTIVLAESGSLYTMGTCHKGLLCNLGSKDGAFGKPWDELTPYKVGSAVRNGTKDPPLSPLAVWPPPYDGIGPQRQVVSAHIHCASVGADGRAWAWGCGSNDGRCGVERFLNMKGEGRPPEVDMMKCYMMGPHRIGVARPLYWKAPSLLNWRVLQVATGRNHMAAIAIPGLEEEPPK